jgi:hypothetical protein
MSLDHAARARGCAGKPKIGIGYVHPVGDSLALGIHNQNALAEEIPNKSFSCRQLRFASRKFKGGYLPIYSSCDNMK